MEPVDPPPKKYDLKPREFERVNTPGPTGKSTGHDVYAMLQQNRAVEQRHGVADVAIKKTSSRRKRDYWLLLGSGNLLLAVITWLGRGNPFMLVCGLAGMVLVSLGLTWIMWFVMSDY